jgi:hypothetical protein
MVRLKRQILAGIRLNPYKFYNLQSVLILARIPESRKTPPYLPYIYAYLCLELRQRTISPDWLRLPIPRSRSDFRTIAQKP